MRPAQPHSPVRAPGQIITEQESASGAGFCPQLRVAGFSIIPYPQLAGLRQHRRGPFFVFHRHIWQGPISCRCLSGLNMRVMRELCNRSARMRFIASVHYLGRRRTLRPSVPTLSGFLGRSEGCLVVGLGEVGGAILGFVEDARYVLADDAQHYQLHAADEQDDGHQRGEAGDGLAPEHSLH